MRKKNILIELPRSKGKEGEGEMSNWIENLKVGDYVFVGWRTGTSLRKVEKITPKGNIKVNGIMFNKNGSERGGDVWSKCYLSEATPEAIKSFREEKTIKKAIKIMREIKTITLEQANKIIELLGTPQNDEVRE